MAETLQLNGNITLNTGRTGDIPLPMILALAALSGTIMTGPVQASLNSGANAITLAVSPTQFIYLKNTHATQTIAVTWTPQGGVSAIVNTLRPGDWMIMSTSAGSGSGFSALSLNASGAATTCEYILFG